MKTFIKNGRELTVIGITPARIYYEDRNMQTDGSMLRTEFQYMKNIGEIQTVKDE